MNFERMPRLYKIMLLPQLCRARWAKEYYNLLLKNSNMKIEFQNVCRTFLLLALILHFVSCFWMAVTEANLNSSINWINENGLAEAGMMHQYMASFYWATVTCTTVGYGDILPTNGFELLWAMIIIVFGVAIFAYVLSNLASQFSEITKDNADTTERLEQIE